MIFRQAGTAQGDCTEGLRHRFVQICSRRINQSEGKVAIMEIPPKIKEYLDNNRGSLPPITDPDEPLHIDSLSFIRLVAFLESEGYLLADEELTADNFATLRKLGELLATKTPSAPTGEIELHLGRVLPDLF
jgi:acyl carrier protein